MKLINILELTGRIELLSGLHIGAGDAEMHIGGTDSPVIKNPHTNMPYIPGSSLKGKMRSLLEWKLGVVGVTGGSPLSYQHLKELHDIAKKDAVNLLRLFGVSGGEKIPEQDMQKYQLGVSRLAFRDLNPEDNWVAEREKRNQLLTETKFENSIHRISGTANSPRNFERVPAGAMFEFNLSLKILDTDQTQELVDMVLLGLKLLELDAIGGSGSRGYGRIKFHLNDAELQQKLEQLQPFGQVA